MNYNLVINSDNKKSINAFIIVAYLFQFGIFLGANMKLESQVLSYVFSVALCILGIFINGFKVRSYVFKYFFISVLIFIWGAFLSSAKISDCIIYFFSFIVKGFSAFWIGSLLYEYKHLKHMFLMFAYLSAVSLIAVPFIGVDLRLEYMRYGYAMLPSVMVFFTYALRKKSLYYLSLTIICGIFMVIYGSRGAVLALCLYVLLFYILCYSQTHRIFKASILFIAMAVLCYIFMFTTIPIDILNGISNKLDISSYAINKFIMMLERGISESSSGRDIVYEGILNNRQRDISTLFGKGLLSVENSYNMYAHNLFLQALSDYGMLGVLFLVCLLVWITVKIFKMKNNNMFTILLLLYSVSFGRLLVSSDIWVRTEFWLMLGMMFVPNKEIMNERQNDEN